MCLFCWIWCSTLPAPTAPRTRDTERGKGANEPSPPALPRSNRSPSRTLENSWTPRFNPTAFRRVTPQRRWSSGDAVISHSSSRRLVSHILASFPVAGMQRGSKMEGVIWFSGALRHLAPCSSSDTLTPSAPWRANGWRPRSSLAVLDDHFWETSAGVVYFLGCPQAARGDNHPAIVLDSQILSNEPAAFVSCQGGGLRAVGCGGGSTQAYNYMSPHPYLNSRSFFLSHFRVAYKQRATSGPKGVITTPKAGLNTNTQNR